MGDALHGSAVLVLAFLASRRTSKVDLTSRRVGGDGPENTHGGVSTRLGTKVDAIELGRPPDPGRELAVRYDPDTKRTPWARRVRSRSGPLAELRGPLDAADGRARWAGETSPRSARPWKPSPMDRLLDRGEVGPGRPRAGPCRRALVIPGTARGHQLPRRDPGRGQEAPAELKIYYLSGFRQHKATETGAERSRT